MGDKLIQVACFTKELIFLNHYFNEIAMTVKLIKIKRFYHVFLKSATVLKS